MHTLALTAPAREIANACTDKRLKYQLLATLDRIDTLAQQLKILAAVKAASPKDTDKDFQLILCATNLMLSIKSCLKDCDTITTTRLLKTRRDSNNGASTKKSGLEAMTFRRKVYKGVAVPGS